MITYGEYKKYGYSAVPKGEFKRYADISARSAGLFLRGGLDKLKLDADGKRCLCEICDIYYAEPDNKIAGFTNDGYREQYFEDADVSMRVYELVRLYFPRDKLFRGV